MEGSVMIAVGKAESMEGGKGRPGWVVAGRVISRWAMIVVWLRAGELSCI